MWFEIREDGEIVKSVMKDEQIIFILGILIAAIYSTFFFGCSSDLVMGTSSLGISSTISGWRYYRDTWIYKSWYIEWWTTS